jgi:hypothetical protein
MLHLNFYLNDEDEDVLKIVKMELGKTWPQLFVYLAKFYLKNKRKTRKR